MNEKNQGGEGILCATLFLTVSTIIVKLLGLFYKIPLAAYLSDEGMGYFNSAYTVFGFFYLVCTAGVPKAIMLLIGKSRAKGDCQSERALVSVALFAFLILGAILAAFLLIFAPSISTLIGNKGAIYTLIAISPSILFVSVSGVLRGVLSADMRFFHISIYGIIEAVSRLVLGLVFAKIAINNSLSLQMTSAFTVFGVTLGAAIGLLYLYFAYLFAKKKKKIPRGEIKLGSRRGIIKSILKISAPITLSAAIMSASGLIDLSLIMNGLKSSGLSEGAAASLYGNYTTAAVPMFNLAIAIITPISVAFMPIFSKKASTSDTLGANEALYDSLMLTNLVGAPIMLGLMAYPEQILSLLFNNIDIEIGGALLTLISPSVFFMSNLLIVNSMLEAQGKYKAPMLAMLVGCIAKVPISLLLIRSEDFGILGAPVGTVVSYAVALFISICLLSKMTNLFSVIKRIFF